LFLCNNKDGGGGGGGGCGSQGPEFGTNKGDSRPRLDFEAKSTLLSNQADGALAGYSNEKVEWILGPHRVL
jgi:hypothetical protein